MPSRASPSDKAPPQACVVGRLSGREWGPEFARGRGPGPVRCGPSPPAILRQSPPARLRLHSALSACPPREWLLAARKPRHRTTWRWAVATPVVRPSGGAEYDSHLREIFRSILTLDRGKYKSLACFHAGDPQRVRFGQSDSGVVTSGYVSLGEARELSARRSGCERDQLGLARTPNDLSQTRERTSVGTLAVYPYARYR